MPRHTENPFFTKFSDLKGAVLRVDFGDAKLIRLSPMSDKEPKDALKPALLGWFGLECFGYLEAALTITEKSSALSEAPPIRPPSTLAFATSSSAFLAFIEPPY